MRTVCHITPYYLSVTTNWIYTQIRYSSQFSHYVLTEKLIEPEKYPVNKIFQKSVQPKIPRLLFRILNRVINWPHPDYLCFEKEMRDNPVSLIHAHFGHTGFYALNLKKALGVPLITRFYGYDVGLLPRQRNWRQNYKKLFAEGDFFIVEGGNMKRLLAEIGCPQEKIFVHHLGIELDKIPYAQRMAEPGLFRVLIAGTFTEKKGIEYAVRALARARESLNGINLKVTIIGDGPLKKKLLAIGNELRITDIIDWLGRQPHEVFIQRLYDADIFLSPSVTAADGDTEGGAPVAIIEASASGLPVISTTHADIPEVIVHNRSGLLERERDVEGLAAAICLLARNEGLRLRFGLEAKRHISANYDAVKQGIHLEQIYSVCLREYLKITPNNREYSLKSESRIQEIDSNKPGGLNVQLEDQITSAQVRLHDKLVRLDLKSSGISEYNQKYLGEKIRNAKGMLKLYGRLLYLSLCQPGVSLERFVFVDYGGGSGVLSLLAKEIGIGTVIYNDIYDVSCSDVRLLSNTCRLSADHVVCGDIEELISYLRLNSIFVNAITSYDVLEHIYNVESHFKKLGSLSDGQFRVVYASGANIENPWYVHTVTKKQIEAEYKNRERKWGHKERDSLKAYHDLRKEIISSYAPDLNSEQVKHLSRSTRGLIKSDIEKCVDEYRQQGSLTYRPDHPTNTCDPLTGNWTEHLMDTRWLQQALVSSGFSVKILTGYYPLSGSLLKKGVKSFINATIQLLGRRGMVIAPYYVVYADYIGQMGAIKRQ